VHFLEKRPVGAFSTSFFVFACVLYCSDKNVRSIAVIGAFLVFAAVIITGRSLVVRGVRVAVTALSAGLLTASLFSVMTVDIWLAQIEDSSFEDARITGVVQSVVSKTSYSGYYIVKPLGDSSLPGDVKLYLTCDSGEFAVGDKICFTADIMPIERPKDYKYSLYSDGVLLFCDVTEDVRLVGRSYDIETRFSMMRDSVSSRLTSEMSEECGGFAKALLLGDRSGLPANVKRDFRCLGISHILALSGTHLTVIFALVRKLIPNRGKLRFLRFLILFGGVLFYMALTGLPASVVRSGIMFIIAATADLINRKADSFTSLSVAVLVICILNPFAPFDVGLQLSYAAVVGLVISDGIQKMLRVGNGSALSRISSKIISAFTVPAFLLPLLWLRFGEISLVSPLANLLLVPLLVPILPVLVILLMFSFITPLFSAFSAVSEIFISAVLMIVEACAKLSDFILPMRGTASFVAMMLFGIAVVLAIMTHGRMRKISGCVSIMLLSAVIFVSQLSQICDQRKMNVYYASSGNDDAIALASDGCTVLVDIGMYQTAIMKAADNGLSMRIDALVLTHLHRNHRRTVNMLYEGYYLKSIWLPVPYNEESEKVFEEISEDAESIGVTVYSYVPGEMISFGNCRMTAPVIEWIGGSSHPAIKFSAECDGGEVSYGSAGASWDVSSDNCVRIVGVHGHEANGALSDDEYLYTVIPSACAENFDSIPVSSVISDLTEICFGDSPTVRDVRK